MTHLVDFCECECHTKGSPNPKCDKCYPAKKTPEEWLKTKDFKHLIIMDPDGWDRKNFEKSWSEKITKEEMHKRVCFSTVMVVKVKKHD